MVTQQLSILLPARRPSLEPRLNGTNLAFCRRHFLLISVSLQILRFHSRFETLNRNVDLPRLALKERIDTPRGGRLQGAPVPLLLLFLLSGKLFAQFLQ